MSHESKGLYKLGGISFIVSGVLFLLKGLFDFMAKDFRDLASQLGT